jgi:hypothetical protein
MLRFGLVLWLFAALVASGWFCWVQRQRGRAVHWLRGPLARVEIQFDCWGVPHAAPSTWRGKWVGTDDPAILAQVERWLQGVRRPSCCNALRQGGGRIVLTFQDGRQEEILFRGPVRPGPGAGDCGGFVWDGLDIVGGNEPFSAFLSELRVD